MTAIYHFIEQKNVALKVQCKIPGEATTLIVHVHIHELPNGIWVVTNTVPCDRNVTKSVMKTSSEHQLKKLVKSIDWTDV